MVDPQRISRPDGQIQAGPTMPRLYAVSDRYPPPKAKRCAVSAGAHVADRRPDIHFQQSRAVTGKILIRRGDSQGSKAFRRFDQAALKKQRLPRLSCARCEMTRIVRAGSARIRIPVALVRVFGRGTACTDLKKSVFCALKLLLVIAVPCTLCWAFRG